MREKVTLNQFMEQAKADAVIFEEVAQWFKTAPSSVKIQRMDDEHYSYIWYQAPDSDEKVVLRLANKNVSGHILGAGTYGRVKYGVDKEGQLHAVKIQHDYIQSYQVKHLDEEKLNSEGLQLGTVAVIGGDLYFQAGHVLPKIVPKPDDPNLMRIYEDFCSNFSGEIPLNNRGYLKTNPNQTTALIKILQAAGMVLADDPINVSNTPVRESAIASDVGLALGKETSTGTNAVIFEDLDDIPKSESLEYGKLYAYTWRGWIGYTIKQSPSSTIQRSNLIRLKPEERFTWPQRYRSKIIEIARLKGDIPAKALSLDAQLSGVKRYQALELGGKTLSDSLEGICVEEKCSITRRLLWKCSKLHNGKLSRTGQGYIHCDLKPQNILVDRDKKNVQLIDYGLSVSADTKGPFFTTSWYGPYVSESYLIQDSGYIKRVEELGTGFDTFSLKRIIHMPAHDTPEFKNRCIFNAQEWRRLPKKLTENISISDDLRSTTQAVNLIKQNKETPLDLAMRFVAIEAAAQESSYNDNFAILMGLTNENKERVCECAELLDRIEPDALLKKSVRRQQIITAANEGEPALEQLKNQLTAEVIGSSSGGLSSDLQNSSEPATDVNHGSSDLKKRFQEAITEAHQKNGDIKTHSYRLQLLPDIESEKDPNVIYVSTNQDSSNLPIQIKCTIFDQNQILEISIDPGLLEIEGENLSCPLTEQQFNKAFDSKLDKILEQFNLNPFLPPHAKGL